VPIQDERSAGLVPLPDRPDGLLPPTFEWERSDPPAGWDFDRLSYAMFADTETYGETWALLAAHGGHLVYERYAGQLPGWGQPGEVVGPTTKLLSWSIAKSVLHCCVGVLVEEGRLALDGPAGVPAWSDPADPRHGITLEHLLSMRDGLGFVEDYDPGEGVSDVITMLFGGIEDMAAFAAAKPLVAAPGTRYSYSSGTSNIVSGLVAAAVGSGEDYERWLRSTLFEPVGMGSATPEFDDAGTWIGSSYLRATGRDWLRFGELCLRDGRWGDRRILPKCWIDHGRAPRSQDEDGSWHGAHWWTDRSELGTFWAEGYEGQILIICPALDLVVARFGRTPSGGDVVGPWRRKLLDTLSTAA
jgi:CubicO group peptidase (beta-lactamase class C family)